MVSAALVCRAEPAKPEVEPAPRHGYLAHPRRGSGLEPGPGAFGLDLISASCCALTTERALAWGPARPTEVMAALTQERLADLAGISRNSVSVIELGEKSPTVRTLAGIARALRVPAHELLRQAEEG